MGYSASCSAYAIRLVWLLQISTTKLRIDMRGKRYYGESKRVD